MFCKTHRIKTKEEKHVFLVIDAILALKLPKWWMAWFTCGPKSCFVLELLSIVSIINSISRLCWATKTCISKSGITNAVPYMCCVLVFDNVLLFEIHHISSRLFYDEIERLRVVCVHIYVQCIVSLFNSTFFSVRRTHKSAAVGYHTSCK